MQRDFNNLLIPVESQVRELDGKILLACIAAEKGFNPIIGSRSKIHFHASKISNAIYIAKSMRRFSNRMFKILNGLGHRIVALDEEALVRLPDQQYYTHRLSPVTFNHIDYLFSWGESDAKAFQNYPHYNEQPISSVGNPRIDILRPELRNYFAPERDQLIKSYGNYILINTNFGQVNHFIPDVGSNEANRDKNFSTNDKDNFVSQRFTHKKKLFESFKQLLPYLAKTFPETHFILRPHPSESILAWQDHLKDLNNVTVNNQGNVVPWIMGAKALISNGCTTSIEATVLEKPTLGYYPIENELIDDKLPKSLCELTYTEAQLAEKLSIILSNNVAEIADKTDVLSYHISGLSGELASDKIIKTLDSFYKNKQYPKKHFMSTIPSLIHNNARTLIKNIKSNNESSRNSAEYHKYRFPHIKEDYLYERVGRFSSLTNRFSNIKIHTISDDVFQINI